MVMHQLGLIISMPAHAVLAIPVAVDQQAVETAPESLLQLGADRRQVVRPRIGLMEQAAVAVGALRIPDPAGQTWHRMQAPVNPHPRLLPGQTEAQLFGQGGCAPSTPLEPGWSVAKGQGRWCRSQTGK